MTPEEQAAFDAVVAERDEALNQAATLTTERDEARSGLRTHLHKAEFRARGLALGLDPEAVDDAFELSRYAPESDEIDGESLDATLADLKGRKPFLFRPATPPADAPPPVEIPKPKLTPAAPPAGSPGRGAAPRIAAAFKVTKDQAADAAFMHANQAEMSKAAAENRLQFID